MGNFDDWPEEMTAEEFRKRMGLDGSQTATVNKRPSVGDRPKKKQTDWGELLRLQLMSIGQEFKAEVAFHPERRWRFDLALPSRMLAVEIEGGTYGNEITCNHCGQKVTRTLKNGRTITLREGGRHNHGQGFEDDCIKYAEAAVFGWFVIRVTPGMIESGVAFDLVSRFCNEHLTAMEDNDD